MAGISASPSSLVWKGASSPYSTPINRNEIMFVNYPKPSPVFLRGLITPFSRRKSNSPALTSSDNSKKKKSKSKKSKTLPIDDDTSETGFDGDPIEALFNLLEEDLKNDLPSEGFDDELTEEELAKLEQELVEALGDDEELSGTLSSNSETKETDDYSDDDEDDEEEKPVELKKWQLRRLASALKIGRRKTSIKSLAAELCLDRAVVLELLREPPPDLLLLSAALPDRIIPTMSEPETKNMEPSSELTEDILEPNPEVKMPVHVMQSRWAAQKRLKKVQIETLERVYNRSKRPTNTMISSIVHVTNLPRKRVLKWFEDKRAEEGVPQNRLPFQRPPSETVVTN